MVTCERGSKYDKTELITAQENAISLQATDTERKKNELYVLRIYDVTRVYATLKALRQPLSSLLGLSELGGAGDRVRS